MSDHQWPLGTNVYVPAKKPDSPLKKWLLRPLCCVYWAGVMLTLFCNGDWCSGLLWPLSIAHYLRMKLLH